MNGIANYLLREVRFQKTIDYLPATAMQTFLWGVRKTWADSARSLEKALFPQPDYEQSRKGSQMIHFNPVIRTTGSC